MSKSKIDEYVAGRLYSMEVTSTKKTKEQKIIDILEWLYVNNGTMENAKEWKKELVKQLYILAE